MGNAMKYLCEIWTYRTSATTVILSDTPYGYLRNQHWKYVVIRMWDDIKYTDAVHITRYCISAIGSLGGPLIEYIWKTSPKSLFFKSWLICSDTT